MGYLWTWRWWNFHLSSVAARSGRPAPYGVQIPATIASFICTTYLSATASKIGGGSQRSYVTHLIGTHSIPSGELRDSIPFTVQSTGWHVLNQLDYGQTSGIDGSLLHFIRSTDRIKGNTYQYIFSAKFCLPWWFYLPGSPSKATIGCSNGLAGQPHYRCLHDCLAKLVHPTMCFYLSFLSRKSSDPGPMI